MSLKKSINSVLRHFNIELHGLGYLQALAKKDFKTDELAFFKKVFPAGGIILFDVGANRGSTIHQYKQADLYNRLYAFEPYPPLFADLSRQFGNDPQIILSNVGISDHEGHLLFNVNHGTDTSSFLDSAVTGLNADKQVKTIQQLKLPVTTLDRFAAEQNINQIHLLKLDVQGSELAVLKGAAKLLQEQKIDVIYTEAYFIKQYIDQPLFPEICAHLNKYGYLLQDIYHPIYGHGRLAWCDAVFVRNDFKC